MRAAWSVLFATALCVGACYGTPRTSVPDGARDSTGSAGAGGSGGTTGATIDGDQSGCPEACPAPSSGAETGAGACIGGACRIACHSTHPTLCAAANACVELTNDGRNCGACGHDCLGGTCAAGKCQPVLIAQYLGHPMLVHVGSEAVYVTTDLGYVGRANKDGRDLKPLAMPGFASSAFVQTRLAEDGDRLFLVRNGAAAIQLSYCSTSNCDSTATPIGGPYTQHFVVDQVAHKIVWLDYTPTRFMSASTLGTLSGAEVPGGAMLPDQNVSRLFYSQGGLYFSVPGGTTISRMPISGGAIAAVAFSTAPLSILGANGSSLFLYDGSAIGTIPLPSGSGGPLTPLIAVAPYSGDEGSFAVDDVASYWVSRGQASTCRLSNCSATTTALPKRATDAITAIGIDAAAVYLLADGFEGNNQAVSTVWKLAR